MYHKAKKVVHHLRKQPNKTKRDILHTATFVCAVILVILWTFTLGQNFNSPEAKARAKQSIEPLEKFKDSILKGYDSDGRVLLPAQVE